MSTICVACALCMLPVIMTQGPQINFLKNKLTDRWNSMKIPVLIK